MKNNKFVELKVFRTRCELSQEDLANLIGQAQSNYAAKENGQVRFFLDEAIAISNEINKILNKKGYEKISIEDLFKR